MNIDRVFESLSIIIETLSDDKGRIMCRKELDVLIQALERLEAFEKLQEEIGMDLLLALKCLLADKIYFISARTNRVEYKSPTARSLKYKSMIFAFDNTNVEFKDYGKTWALTKEELKKDNSE